MGDKLLLHASMKPFIDPLNRLAECYEHQVEELKGMEKFSSKQKENVDMINGWIKDVKALVEALKAQTQTPTE
jgi:t-SNARE complex subunit (syntaxin)